MSERIVGKVSHGATVATLLSGKRLQACRCGEVIHEDRFRSHVAAHRRESVVWRNSMMSSEERQNWAIKALTSRRRPVRSSRSSQTQPRRAR